MVATSWMEKPGGSSPSIALRMPPRFGAWPCAGSPDRLSAVTAASSASGSRARALIRPPSARAPALYSAHGHTPRARPAGVRRLEGGARDRPEGIVDAGRVAPRHRAHARGRPRQRALLVREGPARIPRARRRQAGDRRRAQERMTSDVGALSCGRCAARNERADAELYTAIVRFAVDPREAEANLR